MKTAYFAKQHEYIVDYALLERNFLGQKNHGLEVMLREREIYDGLRKVEIVD